MISSASADISARAWSFARNAATTVGSIGSEANEDLMQRDEALASIEAVADELETYAKTAPDPDGSGSQSAPVELVSVWNFKKQPVFRWTFGSICHSLCSATIRPTSPSRTESLFTIPIRY